MEFYAVSLRNLSLYTTSDISMQCLTDVICLVIALEPIFKNLHSAEL